MMSNLYNKNIDGVLVTINNKDKVILYIPNTFHGSELVEWKSKNYDELENFKLANMKEYHKSKQLNIETNMPATKEVIRVGNWIKDIN